MKNGIKTPIFVLFYEKSASNIRACPLNIYEVSKESNIFSYFPFPSDVSGSPIPILSIQVVGRHFETPVSGDFLAGKVACNHGCINRISLNDMLPSCFE